jgi:glycosyltransferase involved in cell wall biosynthesis
MIRLSAVIITFNEERNIGRCLASLQGVADDIVVVDSNSTDRTLAICEQYKARVVNHTFEGHIEQKNYAITQALHPHVLSLDADECLDETLKEEIRRVKEDFGASGYSMNRLTNYCGQWIKHSGWYPDVKLRLWDSRSGQWGGMNPHDRFEMRDAKAVVKHLEGNILHYSYYTVAEHEARTRRYAEISAKAMWQDGKKVLYPMIFIKAVSKFLRNYFLHLGFLDGSYGLTICRLASYETYLKYKFLYHLQQ